MDDSISSSPSTSRKVKNVSEALLNQLSISSDNDGNQMEKTFSAASTFFSGMLAISASQLLGAPFKVISPEFYQSYVAFTKQSFGVLITTMTQWWSPTTVRVSGDTSLPGQLFRNDKGELECRFPDRLVMMANHQLYTDWLYLWWIAYTNKMHGYIYIILKESLKNLPIVGWGAQFYNFIFLSRKWEQDQVHFESHLDKLNDPKDPMWLLIFPEGTNLATDTRAKSKAWAKSNGLQDMKHQLLPRSKGLQLCLQRLGNTTPYLYDCTIAYEGVPEGLYGQDIFTLKGSLFENRPPKSVNMHFRRFKVSKIPINNDKAFEVWLRNRWREKDYLLEHFAQYKSFPNDPHWVIDRQKHLKGKGQYQPQEARFIQTQIKSNNVNEFMDIFAPLTSALMVGALVSGNTSSSEMMKMLGSVSKKDGNTLITENQATLSTIGRLTPPEAQKELIQRYLNSMKQSIPQPISDSLSLRKTTSRSLSSQPNPLGQQVDVKSKQTISEPNERNLPRKNLGREVSVSTNKLPKLRKNMIAKGASKPIQVHPYILAKMKTTGNTKGCKSSAV